MSEALLRQLADALAAPLPGVDAQLRLAHPARSLGVPAGKTPREAGVLVLLYPGEDARPHFPLIVRPARDARDEHAGQIALPGGSREPADADLAATALREAAEEVGAEPTELRVLGQLSPLYIPVSNFLVTATVASAERSPRWRPQPSEVSRIVHAPLAELLADDPVRYTEVALGTGVELRRVPYFPLVGEVVWGATAMILSELRGVMAALPADK